MLLKCKIYAKMLNPQCKVYRKTNGFNELVVKLFRKYMLRNWVIVREANNAVLTVQ